MIGALVIAVCCMVRSKFVLQRTNIIRSYLDKETTYGLSVIIWSLSPPHSSGL